MHVSPPEPKWHSGAAVAVRRVRSRWERRRLLAAELGYRVVVHSDRLAGLDRDAAFSRFQEPHDGAPRSMRSWNSVARRIVHGSRESSISRALASFARKKPNRSRSTPTIEM
jgi:hypothetical protein